MSVLSLRCFRFCAGMVLLTGALSAQGADYCVGNTPQLRAALDAAAASSEDDVIRLERNSYPLVDAGIFLGSIKGSLVLRGGYANGCPLIGRSLDAATTRILSSTPQERAISLYAAGDDLEIDGLSFEDLLAVSLYSTGNQPTASSGQIWVRRSRFIGNRRALKVFSAHKDVRIENSVFLDNESLNGHGVDDDVAIRVQHVSGAQAPISVDVLFNTVLGNPRGIWIEGGGPFASAPRLQNNIVRTTGTGSEPYALKLDAVQLVATNNIWGSIITANGGGLATNLLNIDAEPQLDAGLVPLAGSPALNSGTDFIAGGLPSTDHDGGPRLVGSKPDRGALESAISDIDTIVVTSTADNGPGTLRQAILDSNQTINAEVIEFDLGASAGCPYFINLATRLPAITSPVTIDALSQPGSSPNSQLDRYDGVHCVVLAGDVTQGLRLQPATDQAMTVRGIAFQRFTEAAIEVNGDGRAVIQSNTFGVSTNPVVPAGFAGDAITVIGTNGTFVGGGNVTGANLIGNADGAGLRFTDCTDCSVRYNFIGVGANGYSDQGNGVGVLVVGERGHIGLNVIGHSATQGIRVEGETASYRVTMNHIGESRRLVAGFNIPIEAGNGTNGIRITSGVGHELIGNTVAHNGTDGVVVLGNMLAQFNANRIYENGQQGIDLSPNGIDPQDSDLETANRGNRGQNYPVLETAIGSDAEGTVSGYLPSSTGTFIIQIFASRSCDDSGFGEGEALIGTTLVEIEGVPFPLPGGGMSELPADGIADFSVDVTSNFANFGLLGSAITATAIRNNPGATLEHGATSEFSACIEYEEGPELFADGFED